MHFYIYEYILKNTISLCSYDIGGWGVSPTGKSFRFVRACARAAEAEEARVRLHDRARDDVVCLVRAVRSEFQCPDSHRAIASHPHVHPHVHPHPHPRQQWKQNTKSHRITSSYRIASHCTAPHRLVSSHHIESHPIASLFPSLSPTTRMTDNSLASPHRIASHRISSSHRTA